MLDEHDAPECEAAQYHRSRMEKGSRALLNALLASRPRKSPVTIANAIRRRPKVARKKGLWPRWYQPPRGVHSVGARLLHDVAEDFGITVGELIGKGRRERLIDARAVIVRILLERGWGCNRVARQIGRDDHSTVINLRDNFPIYAARDELVEWSYERQRVRHGAVL